MEETILTAKDLKFRYDPEQPDYALNGVSAEVKRGEFVDVYKRQPIYHISHRFARRF